MNQILIKIFWWWVYKKPFGTLKDHLNMDSYSDYWLRFYWGQFKSHIKRYWRCGLGIHCWVLADNNLPNVYRTYEQCLRCKKWGKLFYIKEIENGNTNHTTTSSGSQDGATK